jgi:hypothetical protein
MGLDWVLRNRPKKIRTLSDSRPSVRPPGNPTQTDHEGQRSPVADLANATAFETKHEVI